MAKHLQISIEAGSLQHPIANVTPIDVGITDVESSEVQNLITLLDSGDLKPGDGVIEEGKTIKLPFGIQEGVFVVLRLKDE